MSRFTSNRRQPDPGQGGAPALGAGRLAASYRAQGYGVQAQALPDDGRANAPDIVLLLRKGREHTLVHAYAHAQGAQAQGAVQQLASDAFDCGAEHAVLLAGAGFMVSAHQAALRHGHLTLVAERAQTALMEHDLLAASAPVAAAPAHVPTWREATRPAWPLRAAIGGGGMAIAATLAFALMPGLQGGLLKLLHRPAEVAITSADDAPWLAPAASRSAALDLREAVDSGSPTRQAAAATARGLPADFNQALAPRL